MTDFRDAVLLAAPEGPRLKKLVDEGCSSLLVPASHGAEGRAYAGQTWDLNPPDVAYVVAIKRSPTAGPKTWSITCTGCLTLVGMNEHGLCVGTTNVKTYGSRPGVGYLSILHRAVRANDVAGARTVVESAPHAGAHTYWLADADTQIEFEASPNALFVRDTNEGPVWRTTHCIFEGHEKLEGEVRGESSEKRFARLGSMLKPTDGSKLDVDALRAIFADRSDGLLSINRYEEDAQGTATNAVFIGSPSERKAWACRGPADRGEWVELGF
jgi:isopenicillin-N N-acyltransferase-like protein